MKYKGEQLAPLHTIARRLVAFPFYYILKVLMFLVICLGWGFYAATQMWEEIT